MSEKCVHDWTDYGVINNNWCRKCHGLKEKYLEKQNSELQSKVSELEDALRLKKAEQDVYRELGKKIAELEKKNKVMRCALDKYADDGSWITKNVDRVIFTQCKWDNEKECYCGFKLAQQCLKDIE